MKLKTLFLKTPFLMFLCFLGTAYPLSAGADDFTDLNTASLKELAALSGLNENKAKLILESRSKYGNFACSWCIGRRVKGIGVKTLEKFITEITAGGKSYIDICDKCRDKFSESYARLVKAGQPAAEKAAAPIVETTKPSVSINSDPPDAKLFIDGKFAGYTPFSSANLLPGSHEIKLEKKEFAPASDFLKVKKGETASITLTLSPLAPPKEEAKPPAAPIPEAPPAPSGKILVDSQPRGKAITVNGKEAGQITPFELTALAAGEYSIKVSEINGEGGETKKVVLKEGETFDLVFTSKAAPAPPPAPVSQASKDRPWWELWKKQ